MNQAVRNLIKKVPYLKSIYGSGKRAIKELVVKAKINNLKKGQNEPFRPNKESNLIVSMTSFPARINNVWITVESIFQQDYKPWKVVLVLAESEFPGRIIPKSLELQVRRGLEIIWTSQNTRSYKKLLPTRKAYPDAKIITVDDDIIYESWRISGLLAAEKNHPNAIIGYRGWEIYGDDEELKPYVTWPSANKKTKENKVLLTGVGGIFYPPHVLNESILFDIDTALELAPTADDIWFWAVAVLSGVKIHCLGHARHFQIFPDDHENALSTINVLGGRNDVQMKSVMEKYALAERLK